MFLIKYATGSSTLNNWITVKLPKWYFTPVLVKKAENPEVTSITTTSSDTLKHFKALFPTPRT